MLDPEVERLRAQVDTLEAENKRLQERVGELEGLEPWLVHHGYCQSEPEAEPDGEGCNCGLRSRLLGK